MIGGFSEQEITQDHIDIVNANCAKINEKGGWNAASWTINKVQSQVVAGVNYNFHLTADNGNDKCTVKLFVPLPHANAPTEVVEHSAGHNAFV